MFDSRMLNISVEFWAVVFCAIGAVCALLLIKGDRYRGLLAAMFGFEIASAGGDALAGIFRGQAGTVAWAATHVGNLLTFVGGFFLVAAFTSYLNERLEEAHGPDISAWARAVWVASALFSLAAFAGAFYYIDDANVYHRSDLYWVSLAYVAVVGFVNAALVLRSRSLMDRSTLACLLFYTLSPVPAAIVQMFVYGFNFSMSAAVVGLVVVFLEMQVHSSRMLVRRNEELAQSRIEVSESRIAVMVSQIQPHFLFNTLDSIYYLCDENPALAKKAIDDFSRFLRANLNSLDRTEPVPIDTELMHVKTYLELEKMSMEDLLDYEFDVQARGFSVPALAVQTIVENAVKHGVGKKPGGGKVIVRTREARDCYLVSVVDDGVGFDASRVEGSDGVGIENTRMRIAAMCGGDLEVTSEQGSGTIVVMRIPKEA